MGNSQLPLAPGARVVVRDTEWIVRRVNSASDGGLHLVCDGVSEIVRGKSAQFLTRLEEDILVLDPAQTELVGDTSPRFSASLLYIESQLRSATPNDERIYAGHRAAMDLVAYQLDPARQALRQPRQRILIADAVGLGKTLEAGVLVSELIHRGRGQRILVVTLKSMLTQFQKEFWSRFTIPLVRLDSVGLARVRNRIPTNHNPFYYYDKTIISIDTLKGDLEYRNYLETAWWDIIIIDECHNVAERGTSSQRAKLAKLLATRSDTLIMLSATPHDGRARSFASLMNMLDPTAISDPDNYVLEDFRGKGLVIRRFKKDIQAQVPSEFKERETTSVRFPSSEAEEAAYEALLATKFTQGGSHDPGRPGSLVRVGLQKALFSSPAAARESVEARIRNLARGPGPDVAAEIDGLKSLDAALAQIDATAFQKYQRLLALLRDPAYRWSPTAPDDRLVVFSERIETLRFLHERLRQDLRLPENAIDVLHGGLSDVDQQELVEAFGQNEKPLRVLLCSDVASEGLNLHYLCHRLIHFDMPWSLMTFQQRNGRIDRYGQERTPLIAYLITESRNERIRGDQRILEVLQQKDEQAYKNIGDPSVFMNVYDPAKEEELTAEAMAERMSAETFDRKYQPKADEGEDLLAKFLAVMSQSDAAAPPASPADTLGDACSLFASDYEFCKTALEHINRSAGAVEWRCDDQARMIALTTPKDLELRLRQLPREAVPELQQFVLTDDKARIAQEIKRCRQEKDELAWPKVHYLWPQHPVVEWVTDRVQSAFGRHKAPVLRVPALASDEAVFLISGLLPNRKGQPLVYRWLGVKFLGKRLQNTEPLEAVLAQTRLGRDSTPNMGQRIDPKPLQALLPTAVEAARAAVLAERKQFEQQINIKLNHHLEELERLRKRQFDQLELKLEASEQVRVFKDARRAERTKEINQIFDDYIQWIEDTMTTEPMPYLQVIAVLTAN